MKFFASSLLILMHFMVNSYYSNAANILGLMAVASPSNQLWSQVLINELSGRGHNITVLTVDLPKNLEETPKNVHYIHLEQVYDTLYNSEAEEKSEINDLIGLEPSKQIFLYYDFGIQILKGILKSDGFKVLLNYPDTFKFDLVMYDFTVGSSLLGFVHKFNYPPVIGISPFHSSPITQDLVGGDYQPAYIPFYSLTYDTNMNFWQRLHNTYLYTHDTIYRRMIVTPTLDKMIRPVFGTQMPYLADLEKRTVLTLVNSHPAVNYPQPFPPNIIEIGGLQIKDPKPLESDLENFINQARKGAIFFSLGTNMKPEDMGLEKTYKILEVMEYFSDYNFLWKFDQKFIQKAVPKNILIRTFFPQKDILAHPKLKLFVTHAGGLSTQEATWRGVPMVGIPLFLDQHRNLHKSLLAGVAVKVDYLTLTKDSLKNAIAEVLTNKTYAENMKMRSKRFRDRPMKPLDTAVWWVEYVLRHPKAQHLKSPVLELGFFIANSFDILVFLMIVILAIFWIFMKTVIKLFHRFVIQEKRCNSTTKTSKPKIS